VFLNTENISAFVGFSWKIMPYRLCGGVAACFGVACVLCAV
jgi:hypothetical protein